MLLQYSLSLRLSQPNVLRCNMKHQEHENFMDQALELARQAGRRGEVPVGAVVVHDGNVIGRGANLREEQQNPLAHAEIIAIREAADYLGSWRLEDTVLYVTLEPCPMCAGAIINARIPIVVFGCSDPKAGAVHTLYKLLGDPRLNHRAEVISGVRAESAADLLTSFFAELRKNSSSKKES
jgi:tRNA(adenine34) deaminase